MASSKRIQFHIDAATDLPAHKSKPFVRVKITDTAAKENPLRTSTTRCDKHSEIASWQENLTLDTVSPSCKVTFEVLERSPIWAPGMGKASKLAISDAYPLRKLLDMQAEGGHAFDTNIELPLHAPSPVASPTSARLSVNVRELTSRQTAHDEVRRSAERRKSHDGAISPSRTPLSPAVSFAIPSSDPSTSHSSL
ncbi:C2 domain-containing protein [Mycena kentingensis (nom. inval.)]|nr:C2 domain-containing protein [Mycena kentingensis (nom. inval.)]